MRDPRPKRAENTRSLVLLFFGPYTEGEFVEIPTEIVGKYETVDPDTEEILFDGLELRNGMVVVIEDVDFRWDVVDDIPNERHGYYLMVMNRWCLVSNVYVRNQKVEFIATYEDGFMLKRTTDVSKSWIVKKDSIPPRTQAEWEAQISRETDPEAAMKLTGHEPNPSTIVDFDSGETREV